MIASHDLKIVGHDHVIEIFHEMELATKKVTKEVWHRYLIALRTIFRKYKTTFLTPNFLLISSNCLNK